MLIRVLESRNEIKIKAREKNVFKVSRKAKKRFDSTLGSCSAFHCVCVFSVFVFVCVCLWGWGGFWFFFRVGCGDIVYSLGSK